jgi:hypothetical protein
VVKLLLICNIDKITENVLERAPHFKYHYFNFPGTIFQGTVFNFCMYLQMCVFMYLCMLDHQNHDKLTIFMVFNFFISDSELP